MLIELADMIIFLEIASMVNKKIPVCHHEGYFEAGLK